MNRRSKIRLAVPLAILAFVVPVVGFCFEDEAPEVDHSRSTKKLQSLRQGAGPKPVVTVYEVRSEVNEISSRAATDMFTTALIKSGRFSVAERHRLSEGVLQEKRLNAAGQSGGAMASKMLAGASYVFEAAISELNLQEEGGDFGLSVGGADIANEKSMAGLGLDVRIIDADTGLVVDAVNVRKKLKASKTSVSGLGALASSLLKRSVPLDPEVRVSAARKESMDEALRSCIETAVYELATLVGKGGPSDAVPASDNERSSQQAITGSRATGSQTTQSSPSSSGDEPDGELVASEIAYRGYDFVPGDKVIFWDDFSETDIGEFPRKWTLKDCGGKGQPVEVVEHDGRRLLRVQPVVDVEKWQGSAGQCIRWKQETELPEKFTVEFDAVLGLGVADNDNSHASYTLRLDCTNVVIDGVDVTTANTEMRLGVSDGRLHHIAISVNETAVKVFVDNQRVANDPDGAERPIRGKKVGMELESGGHHHEKIMFTNFRLAEGGKDIMSALQTEGRIVTHGILFDKGSDRIKPESLPTLRKILAILEGDPSLKFSIEGHTDNHGGKNVNQPLSERRAGAVQMWLLGKGITADRLRARGWGDAKPIDTNETAEAQANNRRVEFVKI